MTHSIGILKSWGKRRQEEKMQSDWQLWINLMIVSISDSLLTIEAWLDTTDFIGKWMEYNTPCSALLVCVDWMKDRFHREESLKPITVAITRNASGQGPCCSCELIRMETVSPKLLPFRTSSDFFSKNYILLFLSIHNSKLSNGLSKAMFAFK